jgi:hypothetical protein
MLTGVMRSSPSSATSSPNSKQRQSVRQSAGSYCYREINLRRYDNLVQVILTPVSTKMKNALNVQVCPHHPKEQFISLDYIQFSFYYQTMLYNLINLVNVL